MGSRVVQTSAQSWACTEIDQEGSGDAPVSSWQRSNMEEDNAAGNSVTTSRAGVPAGMAGKPHTCTGSSWSSPVG